MIPRLENPFEAIPQGMKAMMALEASLTETGLDHGLLGLVKLRASQINGCAYCIHMHATFLRKHGESEMRLYMLDAWRESALYDERERAALGWTEALTRLAETTRRTGLRAAQGAIHRGRAGRSDPGYRRDQHMESSSGRLQGRASGRAKPAMQLEREADPFRGEPPRLMRLAYRMLGSRRRGRGHGAGGLAAVAPGGSWWHSRPGGLPVPGRRPPVPGRDEIGPGAARGLCRGMAARAARGDAGGARRPGRPHSHPDACARASVSPGARRLPAPRCLRRAPRRGRGDA